VAVDARKGGIVAWSRPDLQQGNDRIEAAIRSGRRWSAVGLIVISFRPHASDDPGVYGLLYRQPGTPPLCDYLPADP
jgi:hypothetical protein